ncbi:putative diphthine methyl ester synthase [Sesamum angolense]|uniref:diphthine methyl ester synthase n=1 Tax=Sesamum angolense TaxID=2727404 RepID=A0AAE1W666_9LAMI|nr:putative diphthine methyl ester synthase [Sesamum angolense]
MLYVIGLGLGDEKDITLRGLEAIKKCSKVYMEAYTSLLSFGLTTDGLSKLEKVYGKPIIVADREMVEEKADDMLLEAQVSDVAFLVVGDPFGATTHSDLVVRAKKLGVDVKVVHNASVMNAIGVCGLQLYRYGETVSIPFFTDTWRPDSFYEKIKRNRTLGLHTLCLLDIRVKEPSLESLCRVKKVYEPPKFMTINTAVEQLLEVEQNHKESVYNEDTTCVGLARVGCEDQVIIAGSMKQLLTLDFGPPLHCLVIVGDTHPLEEEMLEFYSIDKPSKQT